MSEAQDQEFRVRNYAVVSAFGYLRETLGEAEANRVLEQATRARDAIAANKAAAWSPIIALTEVTRAIASIAKGDEAKARELLIKCGGFMALEATNTFLRILMKMMVTPELFAKKVPDLWKRDFNRGRLVVDEVGENKVVFRAFDMNGFEHAPCTAAGFVTFGLKTIGKAVDQTSVDGWSLSKPCADGASFQVSWSN